MNKMAGFESMEQDNERSAMVSHQSDMTPAGVANNWSVVAEMKSDAMDEAYGAASKSGVSGDSSKAHSQFRNYNWA